MTTAALSTSQVADLAGISYRQIDYWLRTDVIPSDDACPGTGYRRRFDERLAAVVAVLAAAVRAGAKPSALAAASSVLYATPIIDWPSLLFLAPDGTVSSSMSGPAGLYVDVDAVLAAFQAAVDEASAP